MHSPTPQHPDREQDFIVTSAKETQPFQRLVLLSGPREKDQGGKSFRSALRKDHQGVYVFKARHNPRKKTTHKVPGTTFLFSYFVSTFF